MKKKNWAPIIIGAAVAGIYGFVTGKGIFNGVRFKNEREAIKGYLLSRKNPASFSNLKQSDNGYMTILTEDSGDKYILYMNRYEDSYIFSEHKIEAV